MGALKFCTVWTALLILWAEQGSTKDLILPFPVASGPATEGEADQFNDFQYIGVTELSGTKKGSTRVPWTYSRESASSGGPRASFAIRIDRGGRVYVSKKKYTIPSRTKPSQNPVVKRKTGRKGRKLSEVFGKDSRKELKTKSTFPYSAVGQLTTSENAEEVTCTAALIGDRVLLTTAHCVYDPYARAWYEDLDFSAGRHVPAKSGKAVDPFTVVTWSHVTTYAAYLDTEQPIWDMAVVTLAENASPAAGRFSLGASCDHQLQLTVAGYPADKVAGTLWYSTCEVDAVPACTSQLQYHYCDTVRGMSGAPMWYNNGTNDVIHAVHAGKADDSANLAVALTPEHIMHISDWVAGVQDDASMHHGNRYIITPPSNSTTRVRGTDVTGATTAQVDIVSTPLPAPPAAPRSQQGSSSPTASLRRESNKRRVISTGSVVMLVLSVAFLLTAIGYGWHTVRSRRQAENNGPSRPASSNRTWSNLFFVDRRISNGKDPSATIGEKNSKKGSAAAIHPVVMLEIPGNSTPAKAPLKPIQACNIGRAHTRAGSASLEMLLMHPSPLTPDASGRGWSGVLGCAVKFLSRDADTGHAGLRQSNDSTYRKCQRVSVEDTPPMVSKACVAAAQPTSSSHTKLKQALETCREHESPHGQLHAVTSPSCARGLHFDAHSTHPVASSIGFEVKVMADHDSRPNL